MRQNGFTVVMWTLLGLPCAGLGLVACGSAPEEVAVVVGDERHALGTAPPAAWTDPAKGNYRYARANCVDNAANCVDGYGFYIRNCTSFVADRMNQLGLPFQNAMTVNGVSRTFHNPDNWPSTATALGFIVDDTPTANAIAQWAPYAGYLGSKGSIGHVALVSAVSATGITIEQYNYKPFDYSVDSLVKGSKWPSNFIHVQPPQQPVGLLVVSQSSGIFGTGTAQLQWGDTADKTSYRVRVSRSPWSVALTTYTSSGNRLSLSGLSTGMYYWDVAACYKTLCSAPTSAQLTVR